MKYIIFVLLMIATYLGCSFNFARLLSNKVKNEDICSKGSGNPGTSNMLRNYGLKLGSLTFVLDVLKGAIPTIVVLVVYKYGFQVSATMLDYILYFTTLFAVIGHIYPFFNITKGGKGIATAMGSYVVINPVIMIIAGMIGLVVLLIFDYLSVFSMTAVSLNVIINVIFLNNPSIWLIMLMVFVPVLCIYAHRGNISRLCKGNERKANFKSYFVRKKG